MKNVKMSIKKELSFVFGFLYYLEHIFVFKLMAKTTFLGTVLYTLTPNECVVQILN